MKKFSTTLAVLSTAAALLAAPVLFADNNLTAQDTSSESAAKGYITRDYDFRGFDELCISGRFQVTLTKSPDYKVKVTIPAEAENLIAVRMEDGTLKIGWNKNLTERWHKNLDDMTFSAEISMPVLRELEMSGASTFECDDKLTLENDDFSMDISGASRVKSLKINAKEIDAEICGAAYCNLAGSFGKAEIEASGAANCDFNITSDYLEIDVSGASSCDIEGKFGTVTADVSGASNTDISGSAEKLSADVSGASKLRAKGLEAKDVTVEASGASHCTVYATRSMTVEDATSASSIKYKAPKNVTANIRSLSRSASIQRID